MRVLRSCWYTGRLPLEAAWFTWRSRHLQEWYPAVLTQDAYRDPFGVCIPIVLASLYVETDLVTWWQGVRSASKGPAHRQDGRDPEPQDDWREFDV